MPKPGPRRWIVKLPLLLEWLQHRILLTQHTMGVRPARLKERQFLVKVFDDKVRHPVQIGEAEARAVPHPIGRVSAQRELLLGRVARDGEGPGANDLRRVRSDVPDLLERARVDVGFEHVPRVDGVAHRTKERGIRDGQHKPYRMRVQRGHGHPAIRPLARRRVDIVEDEGLAV